ncbi:MAG: nucleotide exchange factor GrpE [Planctomycetia bacterium]|nr:nucleotide exchange factor GrpE [Planctomycetia bacterium]
MSKVFPDHNNNNAKTPLDCTNDHKPDVSSPEPTQRAPESTQSDLGSSPLESPALVLNEASAQVASDATEQTIQDNSLDLQNVQDDAPCATTTVSAEASQNEGAEGAPIEPQVDSAPQDVAEPELPAEDTTPCTEETPATEDVVASGTPSVEAIVAGLIKSSEFTSLVEDVRRLSSDFETKLKYDATKQRQIDSLHEENEFYRRGALKQLKGDLLRDLIAEIDDIQRRWQDPLAKKEDQTSVAVKKCVDEIIANLLFVLERHDVLYYEVKEGEPFDPKRHQVLKTIDTADPALANTVLPLRFGYTFEDLSDQTNGAASTVWRKAYVQAYKFNPNLAPKETEKQCDDKPDSTEPKAQEPTDPANASATSETSAQLLSNDVASESVVAQDVATQTVVAESKETNEVLTDDVQTPQDDQDSTVVPCGQESWNNDNTQQDGTTPNTPCEALDQTSIQPTTEESTPDSPSDEEMLVPTDDQTNV